MKALNNLRQAGHIGATAKEHLSGAGTQNR
jgi:hypothetical protein